MAYALRITNIDPMRYKLLFERFLNPDRISMLISISTSATTAARR